MYPPDDDGLHDPDAAVTRAEAASQLGVTPHTISMWVLRGWLDHEQQRRHVTILGRRGRDRLYRWADLLDAERHTRRNPRSNRYERPDAA